MSWFPSMIGACNIAYNDLCRIEYDGKAHADLRRLACQEPWYAINSICYGLWDSAYSSRPCTSHSWFQCWIFLASIKSAFCCWIAALVCKSTRPVMVITSLIFYPTKVKNTFRWHLLERIMNTLLIFYTMDVLAMTPPIVGNHVLTDIQIKELPVQLDFVALQQGECNCSGQSRGHTLLLSASYPADAMVLTEAWAILSSTEEDFQHCPNMFSWRHENCMQTLKVLKQMQRSWLVAAGR